MKYIRTKDGKILSNCKKTTPFTFKGIWKRNIEIIFEITSIYKQANTIEELCDEWIWDYIVDEDDKVNVIGHINGEDKYSIDLIRQLLKGCWIGNVRLGIWTDKGLIYVAKMNEKGELELL